MDFAQVVWDMLCVVMCECEVCPSRTFSMMVFVVSPLGVAPVHGIFATLHCCSLLALDCTQGALQSRFCVDEGSQSSRSW